MAHPPYPWWHFAVDAAWVAPLVAATFLGFLQWQRCLVSSVLLVLLLASRLLTGSGGGMLLLIFELPVLILASILALFIFVPGGD